MEMVYSNDRNQDVPRIEQLIHYLRGIDSLTKEQFIQICKGAGHTSIDAQRYIYNRLRESVTTNESDEDVGVLAGTPSSLETEISDDDDDVLYDDDPGEHLNSLDISSCNLQPPEMKVIKNENVLADEHHVPIEDVSHIQQLIRTLERINSLTQEQFDKICGDAGFNDSQRFIFNLLRNSLTTNESNQDISCQAGASTGNKVAQEEDTSSKSRNLEETFPNNKDLLGVKSNIEVGRSSKPITYALFSQFYCTEDTKKKNDTSRSNLKNSSEKKEGSGSNSSNTEVKGSCKPFADAVSELNRTEDTKKKDVKPDKTCSFFNKQVTAVPALKTTILDSKEKHQIKEVDLDEDESIVIKLDENSRFASGFYRIERMSDKTIFSRLNQYKALLTKDESEPIVNTTQEPMENYEKNAVENDKPLEKFFRNLGPKPSECLKCCKFVTDCIKCLEGHIFCSECQQSLEMISRNKMKCSICLAPFSTGLSTESGKVPTDNFAAEKKLSTQYDICCFEYAPSTAKCINSHTFCINCLHSQFPASIRTKKANCPRCYSLIFLC